MPRSVPQKAFYNCYKNAVVRDRNERTQILQWMYIILSQNDSNDD